jgi:TonB family protein
MKVLSSLIASAVVVCSLVGRAQDIPLAPVRVGGNIAAPIKTRDVKPVYPAEAQGSGAQGVVIIEVTIDVTGKVSSAHVVRSIPLLDKAAIDAVRQWEYTPTLVGGRPVPVIMTVTVNFTIQGAPPSAAPNVDRPAPAVDLTEASRTASRLTSEGRALPPQQASDLEDRLKTNPDDLDARMRLLGYYYFSGVRNAGADATRKARRRHVLWMIEHHPDAELMMLPVITIDPAGHALADPEGYDQAKKLWMQQADRHPDDVSILLRAAHFVRLSDKSLALQLLKQAMMHPTAREYWRAAGELGSTYAITTLGITMINSNGLPMAADPAAAASDLAKACVEELRASSNPAVITSAGTAVAQYGAMVQSLTQGAINQDALAEDLLKKAVAIQPPDLLAPHALADFYRVQMLRAQHPDDRRAMAQRRVEQAELFVQRAKSFAEFAPLTRPWVPASLLDASKAAFDAGALGKAQEYAQNLLDRVDPQDTASGQYVHDAHIVLGRAALAQGKTDEGKTHLLQAGRVTGGGSLTSFGPNMSLARDLLERGERETVLAYLEECRAFWKNPRLDEWIQTIKSGGMPNFGPNLIY